MTFITLSREQFEGILPEGFQIVKDVLAKEIIYQFKTDNPKVMVRLYSTVDISTGVTRDLGKDAIRIIFWDAKNDRPIGKGKKILRVEGATTIEQRIQSRIAEFLVSAKSQNIVDFGYVRSILEHDEIKWMDFAQSLLDKLNTYGRLTDGQLVYVMGEKNPKGKPTFEARVKEKDPDFFYEGDEDEQNMEGEREQTFIPEGRDSIIEKAIAETTKEVEKDGSSGKSDVASRPVFGPREGSALIPTSEYPGWKYPFQYFNPVQSEVFPHRAENSNMIISSNTSSGKTIAAELLMDWVMGHDLKKIIYTSPLKSLSSEKFMDWQERFPDKKIVMLTGDTLYNSVVRDEKMRECNVADIIICTSELLDSCTRRRGSLEKYDWIKKAGLLIVDESHILSTSRGHAVETGIMRFTKINPNTRILFLSATMPNVDELGEWLTTLNGKSSTIIFNTWRPVDLQMHYEEYPLKINNYGREDYWASQEEKRSLAVKIAMGKPDEKLLIFCHDKATGRNIVKRLNDEGEDAVFHNADLDLSERLEVEGRFQDRSNGIKVLVSTSTLAWGRNLPARNVIIVGVHRGINEVDELDIIQMCGRAGRPQYDDEGHVYLIIPEGSTPAWMNTFSNPRPVTSVLNDHRILAFHVLAEIETKEVTSMKDLLRWYSRSLAFRQGLNPFTDVDAKALMEDLEQMEMIAYSGISPFITGLGKVSAWLYFNPYDVYAWYKNFSKVFKEGQDDLTLAWAIGDVPSNDPGYIGKDIERDAEEMRWALRNRGIQCSSAIGSVIGVYHSLIGLDQDDDEGLIKALRRSVVFDIDRINQALSLMDGMYAKWGKENLWQTLPMRIKYSIGEELLELVKLPGIGGKRAKKLYEKGFKTLKDVVEGDKRELATMFPVKIVLKLQEDASRLLTH